MGGPPDTTRHVTLALLSPMRMLTPRGAAAGGGGGGGGWGASGAGRLPGAVARPLRCPWGEPAFGGNKKPFGSQEQKKTFLVHVSNHHWVYSPLGQTSPLLLLYLR